MNIFMSVKSLNISQPRIEQFGTKEHFTGICKQAVPSSLLLQKTGFLGDGVADTKHHGGADKAVCVYNFESYGYWEGFLGMEMPVAAFGENITLAGLDEEHVCIGDIFQLGEALVQVSQPRQPCKTLAARFGRNDFVKLVVQSGRTGFYWRVLEEGYVSPGDKVLLVENDPNGVTVAFANRIYHHDRHNLEGIQRVLGVKALSDSWRISFQELLEKAVG